MSRIADSDSATSSDEDESQKVWGYCLGCGAEAQPYYKFCPFCGISLQSDNLWLPQNTALTSSHTQHRSANVVDTGKKETDKKRKFILPLPNNRESYYWPSDDVKEYDEVPEQEIFWRIKIPINFDIEICQFGPLPTQYNKKSHLFQCFGCGQYPDVYRVRVSILGSR